jgi:hypothetical protein
MTLSGINADTVMIPFGRAIVRAAGDDQNVRLPNAATDVFLGIAIAASFNAEWDFNRDPDGLMAYQQKQIFKYFRKGVVAVKWLTAFSPTGEVYMIHTPTANTAERRGMFRIGAAANATRVANAEPMKSGAAGDVSPIILL